MARILMPKHTEDVISKGGLLEIIKRLLNTRDDLDFLEQVEPVDLERIVVALQARVEGSDTPAQNRFAHWRTEHPSWVPVTPMRRDYAHRMRFTDRLSLDIRVDADDKRLAIHFGTGNHVPVRARNDQGFT